MTVYIDSDYKCHTSPGIGLREVEVPELDGCCKEYIEGMRHIPEGEMWVNEYGDIFHGDMLAAWIDYNKLERAQFLYEIEQYKAALAEAEASYESGVNSI